MHFRFRASCLLLPLAASLIAAGPPDGPAITPWKLDRRLAQADRETAAASLQRIESVSSFFEERAKAVPAFADAAIGYEAKFIDTGGRLVDSLVAFLSPNVPRIATPPAERQADYLRRKFHEIIFDEATLHRVVEAAVSGYLDDLRQAEDRLLIDLHADLELPPLPSADTILPRRYVAASWDSLCPVIDRAGAISAGDTPAAAGQFVASEIVGNAVAKRITPKDAGWQRKMATQVAVGLATDQLLDMAVKAHGYDPRTAIAKDVESSLAKTAGLMLLGDKKAFDLLKAVWSLQFDHPHPAVRSEAAALIDLMERGGWLGLQARLLRLRDQRSHLRRAAIYRTLLGRAPAENFPSTAGVPLPDDLIGMLRKCRLVYARPSRFALPLTPEARR